MKVADLLEKLKEYPLTHNVIMSSDAEGNSYTPLSDVDEAHYQPLNTWEGEISDDEDDECNSIVLVPTN